MTRQENMERLPADLQKPGWTFYPSWIVVTLLCIPIAFFIDLAVLRIVTRLVGDYIYVNGVRHITEDYLAMYPFIPVVSLLTGLLQYWLLRRYLPRMGAWVFATVAGWFLGMLLILIPGWLHWTAKFLNNVELVFLVLGLSIGLAQWVLLRRRLARAGWWIAANVVGWGVLGLFTPGNTLNQYGLFLIGLLPACATAITLAWLMNQVPPVKPDA